MNLAAQVGIATTGPQDLQATPTSADSNPIIKGSGSTTIARTDTIAQEIGLFTTYRQETDTIKEIHHALFYLSYTPLLWNQKGSLAPADFFNY